MATDAVPTQGILFQRGNGATPEVFATVGFVRDVTPPGIKRTPLDKTTQADTWRSYTRQKFVDGGEVVLDLLFVAGDDEQWGLRADAVANVSKNYKIVFPDPGVGENKTTLTFAGLVIDVQPAAPWEGLLGLAVTIKVSGAVTEARAS